MDLGISVIIPSYKPKDYLWQCLDSLQGQTLNKSKFEVILILNGCNEPWKGKIEQYITQKMEGTIIRFVQTDTPGVSNARNIGLDMAEGDFVTFIDDDDYVSSSFLEELLEVAERDVVALSNTRAFIDKGLFINGYSIEKEFQTKHSLGKQKFWKPKKYFGGPCMKLIHKDIIGNRRFDIRFKNGEDSLFMFLVSDRMKLCNFTSPKSVYYRRIREGSAYTEHKTLRYKFNNTFKLFCSYFKVYFGGFPKYNFWFFITRVLGLMKSVF